MEPRIEEPCRSFSAPRLCHNGIRDRTYFHRKVESCPFRNDWFAYISMQRARLYCDCIVLIHQPQSSRVTERCWDTFGIAIIRSAARPLKKMRLISGLPLAQSRLPPCSRLPCPAKKERKKKKRTVRSFPAAIILQTLRNTVDLGRQ